MLARQLEGADAALTDDQRKRLLAVIEERRTRSHARNSESPTARNREDICGLAGRLQRARRGAGAQHPQLGTTHRLQRVSAMAEGNARAHASCRRAGRGPRGMPAPPVVLDRRARACPASRALQCAAPPQESREDAVGHGDASPHATPIFFTGKGPT